METGVIVTIILSVIIPLIGFLFALRPWIKDTVRAELGEFRINIMQRLSTIEGRFEEWQPITQRVADMLLHLPSNPDGRRQELLEKWKQGVLSYTESLELRNILDAEAKKADENIRAIIVLGLIALFIYALTKK